MIRKTQAPEDIPLNPAWSGEGGRVFMGAETEIKVGCCGFAASQQIYFRIFRLIEIQNTFYQLPQPKTAEKWRSLAPQGFEFTMKAWQLITHEPTSPTYRRLREKIALEKFDHYGSFRDTEEVLEAWDRTAMFAGKLGVRLMVFQCPATFRPTSGNVVNMRKFFHRIDRKGLTFAWEPRGAWPEALILRLCEELGLIHCVDPFKNSPQSGDIQYFRLHGITGYAYRYSHAELMRLKGWVSQKPTYLLFNNNWMKEDALRFMDMMES